MQRLFIIKSEICGHTKSRFIKSCYSKPGACTRFGTKNVSLHKNGFDKALNNLFKIKEIVNKILLTEIKFTSKLHLRQAAKRDVTTGFT